MGNTNKLFGVWSTIGTYALLVLVAAKMGALGAVVGGVVTLLTGGVRQLMDGQTTFLMMVAAIVAAVVLELPCAIVAAVLQGAVLGQKGRHSIGDLFRKMTEGNHFFTFFIIVLVEETLARGIFLGLLPKIPFLSGTVAFYVLFLLGNGIWALLHLSNFEDVRDKHPLRVLPQFVAGVFFTYIFVKYGLLASVLAHFACNAVMFAFYKIQRVKAIDALITIYAGVCAAVSYVLMDKPVSDILIWFSNEPTFVLTGWGFWDYVKISVFISTCFSLVFGALLYDRSEVSEKKKKQKMGPLTYAYAIAIPLVIGIMWGLYALLGLFIGSVPYRILVLAILFAFLQTGASGSAIARTFWMGLPEVYISMCLLQALGWWASIGWLATTMVISAPRNILTKLDD